MKTVASMISGFFNSLRVQLNRANSWLRSCGMILGDYFHRYSGVAGRIALGLFFLLILLYGIPAIQESTIPAENTRLGNQDLDEMKAITAQAVALERILQNQERKLAGFAPRSSYLVINTSGNQFFLYRYRQLVRSGRCSTGSYILLKSTDQQKWLFKTPKGRFRIEGKTTDPVWKKPDWAFVESGLPVPPPGHSTRFEYGVLGDYALSLGQGYLIHGTLYKRFLGLPVTHGCVRLNDEDLEVVYYALQVGSRVYIY